MTKTSYHDPVLLQPSVTALITDPKGVYVDATFGGGGHSQEILNQIIANKLTSEECSNGFILDGYPRTISQSEFLSSFFKVCGLTQEAFLNSIFTFFFC